MKGFILGNIASFLAFNPLGNKIVAKGFKIAVKGSNALLRSVDHMAGTDITKTFSNIENIAKDVIRDEDVPRSKENTQNGG